MPSRVALALLLVHNVSVSLAHSRNIIPTFHHYRTAPSSEKYVVAHYMVGNTYSYTSEDWMDDIRLASQSGIDAFALNVGSSDWEFSRVQDAYSAAQALTNANSSESPFDFKLFLSLDMTSLPCLSVQDAECLRGLVSRYLPHPNQLKIRGNALVSTFSGEHSNFSHSSVVEGWRSEFVQHPDLQGKITFLPSFFVDPATFSQYSGIMHGDFNWNSGWPIDLTVNVAESLVEERGTTVPRLNSSEASSDSIYQEIFHEFIGSWKSDQMHLDGLTGLVNSIQKPLYMAAVSPWFFTHYGVDSYNKNFIYLSDQHLLLERWETLISERDNVDIVQIISWNDFGESHYVSPVKGDQPSSQSWTTNMPHDAWLPLISYYAHAFKTGTYPAIKKDQIFLWSRPHSAGAQALDDHVGRPTNFELTEDAFWAVILATSDAEVELSTSNTTRQSFSVKGGITKLSVPIQAGDTMIGEIKRDNQVTIRLDTSSDFTFNGNPQNYNFNAFVAYASAP